MLGKTGAGFKNQVVVITGGGSGIGKAAALAFAKLGARVVIVGRNLNKLQKATVEISKAGECTYFQASIEKSASAQKLIKRILNRFGKVDVLINCAGVYGPIGVFHTNPLSNWAEAININLLGTVNMTHSVLPFMIGKKKGKIINLSGGGAVGPFPNFTSYATSKAAVVRFTETIAKEYERHNIQVNAIAPGAINTSFLDKVLQAKEKAGKEFYLKSLQQKKSGGDSPELAAELMLFLCSRFSGKLTGKLISAKWDLWKKFDKKKIASLNKQDLYTLRRIDNKHYRAL